MYLKSIHFFNRRITLKLEKSEQENMRLIQTNILQTIDLSMIVKLLKQYYQIDVGLDFLFCLFKCICINTYLT